MKERGAAQILFAVQLVTVVGALALALRRVATVTWTQFLAPFDLNHEVPTVNTIVLLRHGVNVYAQSTFDAPPFNLQMYTPAYHYLVAALPWPPDVSPFMMPRLVSAVAMLFVVSALFWVPAGWPGRLIAAAAVAVFLAIPAVTSNIAYARQDPMALGLSLAAMLVLSRGTSRGAIVASASLAVLAVLTKQSYVSAAVAGTIYLWHVRWTKGLTFLGVLCVLGGVAAVGAHRVWGPGFWWSVLIAPTQTFDWSQYHLFALEMAGQWTYVAVVAVGVGSWGWTLARPVLTGRGPITPLTVYVPITMLVLGLTLGKQGANLNYFFEPTLALLAYLVEWADRLRRSARGQLGITLALSGFLALFLVDHVRIPAERYTFVSDEKLVETGRFLRQLKVEVAALDGPARRILFPPYMIPNFAYNLGTPVYLNDAYLYGLLWKEGKLSIESFIASVGRAYFDVVLVPPDEDLNRPKYGFGWGTDRFYVALRRAYRLERTGIFQYHVRRDGSRPVQSAPTPADPPHALTGTGVIGPEPGRLGAAVGARGISPR